MSYPVHQAHEQGDDSMSLITRSFCVGTTAAATLLLWLSIASAQSGGCSTDKAGPQDVVHCPDGLTIIVEKGARYSLADRDGDGHLDAVRLQGKALLLDLPRQQKPARFEVITPQAIAAVRGTKWAVDVQDGKTSVFVVRGQVGVRRPAGAAAVVLRAGQGVDVEPGGGTLEVKRWKPARVTALMARLGQ
jgi:ferric-dicitrate binding protein FerR (iron transport regulator)